MPKLTQSTRRTQATGGQNVISASAGSAGVGLQQAGADISAVADGLAKAHARIQNRNNAISRVRDLGEFSDFGAEQFAAFQTEKDFSDPLVVKEYNETLRTKMADIIGRHQGDGDSSLQLTEQLEGQENSLVTQASTASVEAGVRRVNEAVSGQINQSAARISENPTAFAAEYSRFFDFVDSVSGGISPSKERLLRARGVDTFVRSAVSSLLANGNASGAEEVLNTPGVSEMVSPESYEKMTGLIADSRRPGDLVEIGDSTSPTGSRFVSKEEARGKPGRPRTSPIVNVTNLGPDKLAETLGKLDAERVVELEKNGQRAIRSRAEIQRMQAAIDSGRFRTGSFSDIRSNLSRLGNFAGLGPDSAAMKALGDAATADTFDAATNLLAVEMASSLGRVTNMSLGFIRDSLPALSRTMEGNRILLDVMDRTAERELELASLANEFIQLHGSLRPQGRKTYFQMVRDIEENDPVVSAELRERIIQGSQDAPKSVQDALLNQGKAPEPPEGLVVPDGWKFLRMDGDRAVIEGPNGEEASKKL